MRMANREKVVAGLECCVHPHGNCSKCPYDEDSMNFAGCTSKLCADVLALLNTQQLDIDALKNTMQGMIEGQCVIAGSKQPEIVRCKDCKFKEKSFVTDRQWWCNRLEKHCEDNWFCADGKRD